MEERKTIALVLRSGGDFKFRDVELIARHINGKWKSAQRPRIICLWDQASQHYDLGNVEIIPFSTNQPGTWSRIHLYSPEMEQYRPFLYVDLDTAIIQSLENIFDLVKDESNFIALEDFWQKNQLATGLVWFPKNNPKIQKVWDAFRGKEGARMDVFLRRVIKVDAYWQNLTKTIYDFKPSSKRLLTEIPANANLICFHGKPRIFEADVPWVVSYVNQSEFIKSLVSIIIPYKKDRGWLQEAIDSVPKYAQLIVSQGEGNWPANFNKGLQQATGQYIKWLHEDDMLTPNCIVDSINAFEKTGADFIHGNVIEIRMYANGRQSRWKSPIEIPTLGNMLQKNTIHSASLMYKREVFNQVGLMDESLNTAEEYEFNLRCLKAGLKLGYCDSTLAYYRRHFLQKVRVVPKPKKDQERQLVRNKYIA